MSELPNGWERAEIGDLCNLINGRAFKPQEWSDSGLPIIRIQNLNNPASKFNHFSGDFDAKHHVKNGDLLFAWSGTPGTSFGAHIWHGGDAVLNQHIFKIEFSERETNRGFLRYAINQKLDELISSAQGGVGLRHVTKGTFEKTEISFPPLAEQTRIAQKLDELLAQVDTLKARIDGIPALLKRFRQSVLAAAISGRLTEEWRATLQSAECWKTVPVGALCSSAFDGPFGSKLKSDDYTAEGVRVVRLENIGHLSFIGEKKTFISVAKHAELSKNTLRTGDILFSSFVDEEIRVCRLPKSEEVFINKADCFCLRIDDTTANPSFVMYALAAKHTYQRIRESVHGATRPRINLGFLKSFEIELPPQAEQTEIVRRVEQLFAFADQLEAKVASAKSRIDHLTQSILAKAFRGELVPQDPNDEPASVLLERIKAQRAAAPKAKRGRKASA